MKQCIFCGDKADSNEDLWPQWLIRALKRTPDEKIPMSVRRHDEKDFRRWTKVSGALRVKLVCCKCNNGWMSDLEGEAKPILTPMMLGEQVTLSASQQHTVARWVTKCAMVFDSVDRGEQFYDGLDRHDFHQRSEPSVNSTNIWLGKQIGPTGLVGYTDHRTLRTGLSRRGSDVGSVKQYINTMVFGHLVMQIASIKRLVHSDKNFRIKAEMASGPWIGL